MFCLFYRYWWNSYIQEKCLSQKCYETRIWSCVGEIKTVIKTMILIFFLYFRHHFPRLRQIFLNVLQAWKSIDMKIWQLVEKVTGNCTVFAPRSHFVNEISKEPAARLNGKLSFDWLIMLVTMATPNSIFAARDENMTFKEKEKYWYFISIYILIRR